MYARGAGLYGIVCLGLLAAILWLTGGHFAYIIDDPYIHLALAENLPAHMGANTGEVTNSSSSILFPWLLVPFARSELAGTWAPLILNYGAGLALLYFVGRLLAQSGLASVRWPWLAALAGLSVLVACNTFSLVFIGMEHTLHLAAVAAILCGLITYITDQKLPRWFWLAFMLAPLLRYEALALNLLIAVWLLRDRQWRLGALALALTFVPQALYGLYMHALGLPILPSSILAKSPTIAYEYIGHNSLRLLVGILYDFFANLEDAGALYALIYTALLLALAVRRTGRARWLALVVAGATLAHLLFGRFAWFGRYHAYIQLMDIMTLAYLLNLPRAGLVVRAAFATLVFMSSLNAILLQHNIAVAAQQVYQQPLQMARLVRFYWPKPVLAHDVGAISWLNPQEVGDVLGLISEKSRKYVESMPPGTTAATYLQDMAHAYGADLAIIHEATLNARVPQSWVPIASLQFTRQNIIMPASLELYATTPDSVAPILDAIRRWSAGLPDGVALGFNEAVVGPH